MDKFSQIYISEWVKNKWKIKGDRQEEEQVMAGRESEEERWAEGEDRRGNRREGRAEGAVKERGGKWLRKTHLDFF